MQHRQGVVEGRDRLNRVLALVAATVVVAPAPAAAAPPQVLPTRQVSAPPDWIVSARDSNAARSLALRAGVRPFGATGQFLVPRAGARALADALDRRGLLRWAEPNRQVRRASANAGSATTVAWRERLGLTGVPLLPVRPDSPQLALLDSPVDLTHPVFAGTLLTSPNPLEPYDLHGTATASVAAGTGAGGVLGVRPGMRVANHAFPDGRMTCAQSASLIDRAVAEGAAVINMSYGSEESCFTEFAALQHATQHGVIVVAAAGNERMLGNPVEYPGAFPHVITAAALGSDDAAAPFSIAGEAINLAAPGTDIPVAVPWLMTRMRCSTAWQLLSGTSFAAPMVAGAATALRAARPNLTGGQIAALLCASARDIPPAGWDRRTGCGAPDLGAALRRPAPVPDPTEPNDDVVWVDGIGLGRGSPPVWNGGHAPTLRATVTAQDDPVDVYRVRLRPHSGLRVTLSPRAGGADLRVLDRGALDVGDRDALLATARLLARRTDRESVRNDSRRGRVMFVAVTQTAARSPGSPRTA